MSSTLAGVCRSAIRELSDFELFLEGIPGVLRHGALEGLAEFGQVASQRLGNCFGTQRRTKSCHLLDDGAQLVLKRCRVVLRNRFLKGGAKLGEIGAKDVGDLFGARVELGDLGRQRGYLILKHGGGAMRQRLLDSPAHFAEIAAQRFDQLIDRDGGGRLSHLARQVAKLFLD